MNKYKKARIIGNIINIIVKIIRLTIKIEVIRDVEYKDEEVYVYGFWHGNIFMPLVNMAGKGRKIINMVSPSKDGEIIAVVLEKHGYTNIRASSDKDSVRGLVEAIKKIKAGYSIGFAADGPKGPPKNVKPGIVYVAQKSGRKIVPLGSAISSKWIIKKAWDKTEIPKPFSKCVYYIGKPFEVPKDADVEEYLKITDNMICQADNMAADMLNEIQKGSKL